MQGHRADTRRWIVLAVSAATVGMLALIIGWSGNPAGAAIDGLAACATPTALPTGTLTTGTPGPSPTAPPPTPTATAPQIIGRLLGDAPATAIATVSPPPPPCTPTPVPTELPPTPTTIVATATASVPAAAKSAPTVAPPPTTIAPPIIAVRASAQAATAPAAPSSSTSSSSSRPPAAAVGLPPPPLGYTVGNTPNSVGGANAASFPSAVGTPVVSVVRGNVAPAGAANIPFPGSAPVAARSPAPPGYVIGPTGVPVPVITPRAGYPRTGRGAGFALLVGAICMAAGLIVRRKRSPRAVRA